MAIVITYKIHNRNFCSHNCNFDSFLVLLFCEQTTGPMSCTNTTLNSKLFHILGSKYFHPPPIEVRVAKKKYQIYSNLCKKLCFMWSWGTFLCFVYLWDTPPPPPSPNWRWEHFCYEFKSFCKEMYFKWLKRFQVNIFTDTNRCNKVKVHFFTNKIPKKWNCKSIICFNPISQEFEHLNLNCSLVNFKGRVLLRSSAKLLLYFVQQGKELTKDILIIYSRAFLISNYIRDNILIIFTEFTLIW